MDTKPNVSQDDIGEPADQEDFPYGMAPKMLNMLQVVDKIEKDLTPLISRPYYEVLNKLPPLDRAKIGMMEIYTINSLFWVLMRTSGEDIDLTLREDSKVEMNRLKETQARIGEVEARAHRQRLDTEVASRFIRHGLGIRNAQVEEEVTPSSFMAERRKRIEQQETQESSNSSESEGEDSGCANRTWYGKGW
ncbi:nuclear nucleic acid-binding protein C1D-like [Homarus americanus]|uniref:nuclear nucleic acid-binding protein C1D-like n=1 Tax=Homarus americanus TaxID=6706 RepID=UPI001C464ED3|nr:nuclear nucleic acid-binding protein C1D-like [Homarus americanus]XP_042215014.1 nuclear nucleic acid-binding protein C1D-like [Homarus americanus]